MINIHLGNEYAPAGISDTTWPGTTITIVINPETKEMKVVKRIQSSYASTSAYDEIKLHVSQIDSDSILKPELITKNEETGEITIESETIKCETIPILLSEELTNNPQAGLNDLLTFLEKLKDLKEKGLLLNCITLNKVAIIGNNVVILDCVDLGNNLTTVLAEQAMCERLAREAGILNQYPIVSIEEFINIVDCLKK